MIDIAQVQGQVHAQSVQKVGELADKNPNETVSIIRSWLHETRPDRHALRTIPNEPKARPHGEIASVDRRRWPSRQGDRQAPQADRPGARGRADAGARRSARRQHLEPARRRRAARDLDRDVHARHGRRAAVESLLLEFVSRMSASGALMGNYDATERLLQQYLPPERVGGIMDEIRGPAGRNMWEKLSNVQEEVLANYLKNEYPQTVAVVLSKLRPEHAARVLAILPEELALDVVNRMLQDGSGAEGSDRAGRTDAAHRIHVEPVADAPTRRPRGDGGDLQQFRPPDRDALHDLARRATTAKAPSASRR